MSPRLGAALALLASALPAAAAEGPGLRPVPLEQLRAAAEAGAPVSLQPEGLVVEVPGFTHFALPFAAEELELEVRADGPVLLTWAARPAGGRVQPYGPPWRYVRLPREPRTLRLDLRLASGWSPRAQPVLLLGGGGRVVVRALRQRPPRTGADARAAYDRALLLAPQSVGHTTINLLTAPLWSASRGVWLADVVGAVALAAFLAVLAAVRLARGRLRPGLALVAAAVVAVALWDAHLLVRFLPTANLSLEADPEVRIRENLYVAPEVGALAALARATLSVDERVGVMASARDWFAPQALCFNLHPRRCAIVRPDEPEHAGLSGVGRLRPEELDAVVSYRGGTLPDGFVPVAEVSPHAVVARRR